VSARYPELYLIGLTGNIGCGKSTVGRYLAVHGAQVCDADQVTRTVMQPGEEAYQAIVAGFGAGILQSPGGPIDRPALGRIVFADPAALRRLEAIVHPATRRAIEDWLAQQAVAAAGEGRRRVAVVDAIKLIENGYPAMCDAVWVVICDEREQLRRLVEIRGMTEADARSRIAAQPPQADKVAVADVVIDNSGMPMAAEQQVARAYEHVRTMLLVPPT
jgi:dephospho-CoA kinase